MPAPITATRAPKRMGTERRNHGKLWCRSEFLFIKFEVHVQTYQELNLNQAALQLTFLLKSSHV